MLDVIQRSTEYLGKKGVDSPRLQVELLLAHVLQMPRLNLYLNFDRELAAGELQTLRWLVQRRGSREPLQHILGATSFCGLELLVNADVLVPRPETELLAERSWEYLNALPADSAGPRSVFDFGTGSGCLAVTLAVKCPAAQVYAVDTSSAALAVARENARRHQVADRIEFFQADGFPALRDPVRFDLVVANPPYIPSSEIAGLQPEVRDHDPRVALDGGPDGLDFFRRLAAEMSGRLRTGGRLMAEFGDGQAQPVRDLFLEHGCRVEAVECDLSGRPRIVIASPGQS